MLCLDGWKMDGQIQKKQATTMEQQQQQQLGIELKPVIE